MKCDRYMAAVLLTGVLLGLWACGEGGRQAPPAEANLEEVDPQGQTVSFWHQYKGNREKALIALIENFNRNNPHAIEVKGEYIGNYNTIYNKMLVSIQGGYLPQLVLAYKYQAEAYYRSAAIVDLSHYMDSPRWGLSAAELEDYNPSFLAQDKVQGVQLALLPHRSMEILYYNESWLGELGYDGPPQTWSAFAEMCRRAGERPFSRSADPQLNMGFLLNVDASRLAAMVFSRGGDFVGKDDNAYTFDTPQTRASLDLLQELKRDGVMDLLRDDNKEAFGAGQVLFAIHSSSRLPFFIGTAESGVDFDWNVAPLPHVGEKPVQNVYGGSISVCKSTPQQQLAAWLFIKWFTEPAQQERWVQGSNYFPVRLTTARELEPYFRTAYGLLDYGKLEPSKIGYEAVRTMIEEVVVQAVEGAEIAPLLTRLEAEANKPL